MKVIILASGIGKRLKPLTDEIPKALVEIDGKISILERILQSFRDNNIRDVIITTGPFEEKIKRLVAEKFSDLNVSYIPNPDYARTNYIYSFWLTKEAAQNSDIILLHGDLVYDFSLMERIVKADRSCVLIKKGGELPQKDFKAEIKDGLVAKIGVDVFGKEARACMPLYKLTASDFGQWLAEVERFVKEGDLQVYAENALNPILSKLKLHPLYYDKEFCMEVDDFDDLAKARNLNFRPIDNTI